MREANFVGSVNRHLPKAVHHEGMSNPYRGGTPDQYYEGLGWDLWVEYKFYSKLPPWIRLLYCTENSDPKVSVLQQEWLERAHRNRKQVAVIVGSPGGGLIMPGLSWKIPRSREHFEAAMLKPKAIAQWITAHGDNV